MLNKQWMRVHNTWKQVCHYLFILTTVLGWVVPWITPHYYQAHPIRMRYSTVFQRELDQSLPVEENVFEERSGEVLQNACRI